MPGGSQDHPGSGRPRKTAYTQRPWERKGPKQGFSGPGGRITPNQLRPTRTRRQGRETLTATPPADTAQRGCTRCFGLLLSGADGFTRCASCGREEGWLERSLAPATKVVKGDTGPKVHPATAQRDFDGYRDANRRAEAPRVAAEAQNPAPVRCLTCLANIPGADLAAICTDYSPTKEAQEVRAPKGQLALL